MYFPPPAVRYAAWSNRSKNSRSTATYARARKLCSEERGNLEGAAAYAAITPRQHRADVARAVIAFQAVYDYADALSEQPDSDRAGIRRLHQALLVALKPGTSHLDYYEHQNRREDGGYLDRLVDRCRSAVSFLPSFPVVALQIQQAASRIVTYQCLNHRDDQATPIAHSHAGHARKRAHRSGLRWWETGAAAGSSLSVFALISAAARTTLHTTHVTALDVRIFPLDRFATHPPRQPHRRA